MNYNFISNTNLVPRPLYLRGISFTWQETKILQKIRNHYQGEKYRTAITIYVILTEFASLAGKGQGKSTNHFKAYLSTIADRCRISTSTLKRYLKEFRRLKIIAWDNRRAGTMNLSNEWWLLSYYQHINKPTSGHNSDLVIRNYIKRSSYNNKSENKNSKDSGFTPIKNILKEKSKNILEN